MPPASRVARTIESVGGGNSEFTTLGADGPVDLAARYTLFSNSIPIAVTLPDGTYQGQMCWLVNSNPAQAVTLTGTYLPATSIEFSGAAASTSTLVLVWTQGGWFILLNVGCTVTP